MANNFAITISAVDGATATIRKVNDSIDRMMRPINHLGKSFGALGKELGFDKIGRSMKAVGSHARTTVRTVERLAAPMAALTGVTSVAAVVHLADSWAHLGRSTLYASQNVGMSVTSLQSLDGAARLAGISSQAMNQSLTALGNTMWDAKWGRNQPAMVVLKKLGIQMHTLKNGSVDTKRAMLDISRVLQEPKFKGNAQLQNQLASVLPVAPILPLLRMGPDKIHKLSEEARRLGVAFGLGNATQFAYSLAKVSLATDGLKYAIGDALIPAIEPLAEELVFWIQKNRELIAQDVAGWAKEFAHWLQSINWKEIGADLTAFIGDIKSLVVNVEAAVAWLGGWKDAAIDVAIVMSGLPGVIGKIIAGLVQWRVAAEAAAAAQAATGEASGVAGAAGTAGAAEAGGLLGTSALAAGLGAMAGVAAAGYGGYLVGHEIYKHAIAGTSLDDYIGGSIAKTLAMFGDRTAQGALANNRRAAQIWAHPASSLPLGLRQNNPGNLRSWGDMPQKNGFAVFPSAHAGIQALARQLQLYGKRGNDTISGIVNTYAPAKDHNNVDAYIKALHKDTGFDPNKHLNLNDPATVTALARGIIRHEQGSDPYAKGTISSAVAGVIKAPAGPYWQTGKIADAGAAGQPGASGKVHVEVALVNAPPGTQAKVKTTGSVTAAARIGHSAIMAPA